MPTEKDYPSPLPATAGICDPRVTQMKRAYTGGAVDLDLTSPQSLFKVWLDCVCREGARKALQTHNYSPGCRNAQALKANGPLAVTIWADSNPSLQFYKAGIYSHPDSPLAGEDRAVTLVGWGEEKMANGTLAPYWIILNSWGTTWCA